MTMTTGKLMMKALLCFSVLLAAKAQRVAIIGGGISGTFSAKYLADYDTNCTLESVRIFDPQPLGQAVTVDQKADVDWQGSRVSSLELEDGTVVELGASVAFNGFRLLVDMIDGDDSVVIGAAHNTGRDGGKTRDGIGIYDGNGAWSLLTSNSPSFVSKLKMLWRYNVDLFTMSRASATAETGLERIHRWLNSTHPTTFFESPDEMWHAAGLHVPAHMSFDAFLDAIGLPEELPWWRRYLPYQGSLRAELLTAINLCNYNQANSQVNGLVGVGSFISAKVKLFSIVGGNRKVIKSAFDQAQAIEKDRCGDGIVLHVTKRVTSVVSDLETMELFDGTESLGHFDVVILAAPIQQSRISFLIRSDKDSAVLHDMPLLSDSGSAGERQVQDLQNIGPTKLPDSVSRPYKKVVTTVVGNATLQADHFYLKEEDLPRGIYMTETGKELEFGITAVAQMTSDGVYKIFSSNELNETTLSTLFENDYSVQYVKIWGGPYGGATPDYRGEGTTVKYALYDTWAQVDGFAGSALYYANAIETSFACMELSAIGAKSVARLVARRLGMLLMMQETRDERSSEL